MKTKWLTKAIPQYLAQGLPLAAKNAALSLAGPEPVANIMTTDKRQAVNVVTNNQRQGGPI